MLTWKTSPSRQAVWAAYLSDACIRVRFRHAAIAYESDLQYAAIQSQPHLYRRANRKFEGPESSLHQSNLLVVESSPPKLCGECGAVLEHVHAGRSQIWNFVPEIGRRNVFTRHRDGQVIQDPSFYNLDQSFQNSVDTNGERG